MEPRKIERGKIRKAIAAVKTTVRKAGRFAVVPLLAAGLMLVPAKAKADEPRDKPKASLIFNGGAYDKMESPFIGAGMSVSYSPVGFLTLDALTSVMVRVEESNSVELNEAGLSATMPITGPLSMTLFGARSQFYGDDWEAGAAFHFKLPNGAIHIVPQVITGGFVPVPVVLDTALGPVNVSIGVITIVNHGAKERPAPLIGGEGVISIPIGDLELFAKLFEMTVITPSRDAEVGALSLQAGLKFNL